MKIEIDDSNYLKPEEVPQRGAIIKLTDEGTYVEKTFDDKTKKVLQFEMEFMSPTNLMGETRTYTMNKTSQKNIRDGFGDDSKDWMGKEIILIAKKEDVKGQTRAVIYAEPYQGEQSAADSPKVNKIDVIDG